MSEEIRKFWSHVRVTDSCWEWTGPLSNGYGRLAFAGMPALSHRVSYELFVGPLLTGMHIDHRCRNRACVRPDHLEQVTPSINSRLGVSAAVGEELPAVGDVEEWARHEHNLTRKQMKNMSINALTVALRYQPELGPQIVDRRGRGESIDALTRWLCTETGLEIGRESVRAFLKTAVLPS